MNELLQFFLYDGWNSVEKWLLNTYEWKKNFKNLEIRTIWARIGKYKFETRAGECKIRPGLGANYKTREPGNTATNKLINK